MILGLFVNQKFLMGKMHTNTTFFKTLLNLKEIFQGIVRCSKMEMENKTDIEFC